MKLSEYIKKYGDCEVTDEIDKCIVKMPKTVYDLKDGDRYCYITADGELRFVSWQNDESDKNKLYIGNIFLTEEDAEFAVEHLKVAAELKKYAKEFSDGEWKDNKTQKYYIVYRYSGDYIRSILTYTSKDNVLYFESPEKIQEAIDAVGEDRIKKYYFGVRE